MATDQKLGGQSILGPGTQPTQMPVLSGAGTDHCQALFLPSLTEAIIHLLQRMIVKIQGNDVYKYVSSAEEKQAWSRGGGRATFAAGHSTLSRLRYPCLLLLDPERAISLSSLGRVAHLPVQPQASSLTNSHTLWLPRCSGSYSALQGHRSPLFLVLILGYTQTPGLHRDTTQTPEFSIFPIPVTFPMSFLLVNVP